MNSRHLPIWTSITIQTLTLGIVAMLAFLAWQDNIKDANKHSDLELAKERCLILDPHFTDAVILDGTTVCIGNDAEVGIPIELIIQALEGQ